LCDDCGVHLTPDSFKGRTQHSYGAKHRQLYYAHYMRMADDLEGQGIIVPANGTASEPPGGSGVRGAAFGCSLTLTLRVSSLPPCLSGTRRAVVAPLPRRRVPLGSARVVYGHFTVCM
jgi:hypothetical protein